MSGRAKPYALPLVIAAAAAVVASPATATAGSGISGGAAFRTPTSTGAGSSETAPSGSSQAANRTVRTSGNGFTLATRASALLRSRLRFSGTVSGAGPGWIVEIERRDAVRPGPWLLTTHSAVRPGGGFTASWPATRTGRFAVRAVLERSGGTISRVSPASPSLIVTVYRPAIATIFGPGFFGQQTACGEILRRSTLGVANRTLPCGTRVSLLWHGRSIVVPVIDRGPYANHADWDLTTATASALGMSDTETIGAVPLPR